MKGPNMNNPSISVGFSKHKQQDLDLYTLTSMSGPDEPLTQDEFDTMRAEVCNGAEEGDIFRFYTVVDDDGGIFVKRITKLSPLRHPRIA